MYMSHFKTEKFKKLQSQWYKKLQKEGFQDAEALVRGKLQLKAWHSSYFSARYSPDQFAFKKAFYEKLNEFLLYGVFDSDRERAVFTRYCGGATMRAIAVAERMKLSRVYTILRKYRARMLGDLE